MVNIIILGGGFGGIRVALNLSKKLNKKDFKITLIDRNSYHLFLPSLYEAASAYGIKRDQFNIQLRASIGIPYAEIFNHTNVNFVQAEVTSIDLRNKKVLTQGEMIFDFDYLIIGFGSEVANFDIPGVTDYAYQFKDVDDAIAVRQKIEDLYELATKNKDHLPVKIIIGGAGFTGIELGAELACCIKNIIKKCGLSGECISIIILEAMPQILPMVSDKERKIIKKRLAMLGVNILESSPIEEVGPNYVKIKDGSKLESDITVWTAGIKAPDFLKNIEGLKLDERGRIIVNEFLQVNDFENIFAIGDNIVFVDPKTQKPVPAMAYVAIEQGKIVGKNVIAKIFNKKLKKYRPWYGVWIAPVGAKFAVARIGRLSISGFLGWVLRELVDFRYFVSILPFFKAFKFFSREFILFSKND